MVSWVAAPMLALVVALVLMQSERDFWPDHLFLMMVIGSAAVWYLRDARLAAGALAFALVTCWLDLGPPIGPDPLHSMVAAPEPPPGTARGGPQNLTWVEFRWEQQADAQRRLYTYVVLNAGAFLGLLALAEWKRRRREREEPDRSRSGRSGAPLILALEERGHVGFGVPRRQRRSPEGRGLMGSYVLALPLLAMLCGVYAFPMRSFEVDGIILVVVIGAAAVWYLREPRLAGAAIAFAAFTWALDPSLPDSLVGPLQVVGVPKWIAQATPPAGATRPQPPPTSGAGSSKLLDFPLLDALDFKWQQRRLMTNKEAQAQLDRFLILNGVWFTLLASVAASRRLAHALEEDKEARAAARREKARLARSRI